MNQSFRIIMKESLTPVTNRFVIEAPWVARAARPGQFVIVRVHEKGERIPVTLADFDPDQGTITVVVQEVGRTSRLFGALAEGETVMDVAGPLGEPYVLRRQGTVMGIGGGFGAAALLPLLRALNQQGAKTEAIIGARTKELLIVEKELQHWCRQVWPCTDDGSYGFHGLVTDQLKKRLEETGPVDEVVVIGPMPMMRAVASLTEGFKVPTQVSLDPIMVDGTGMCGGCRVTVNNEVKFACVDGPFFDGHAVDFAECTRRNKTYIEEESVVHAG